MANPNPQPWPPASPTQWRKFYEFLNKAKGNDNVECPEEKVQA